MQDASALASIPSGSSSASRLGTPAVQRSPAQTSVAPLLEAHPSTSIVDQDFPQSGQDSLRRKSKRRSLFRRGARRRSSVESDLLEPSSLDGHRDDRFGRSPPQQDDRPLNTIASSLPVKILVAPYIKSPASDQQQPTVDSFTAVQPIDLLAEDAGERRRAEREIAELLYEEAVQVRDVLYENQRGILFRGVPYFSAMTLFPFDPDAWSLVNSQVSYTSARPTTIQAAAENPPLHISSRGRKRHGLSQRNRYGTHGDEAGRELSPPPLQDTPFTPSSFQLPSPAWRWASEWSVAMQTDGRTDEHGWEYNWIFKSRGWHAHVNTVGWAGWVRRRKWTRLREYSRGNKES